MQFCFHDNSPIYGLVTAIIYHTGTGGSGTSHDIGIAQPHLDFHPGHESGPKDCSQNPLEDKHEE